MGEVKNLKWQILGKMLYMDPLKIYTQSKCTHLCICFYIALVGRSFKMAYHTVVLCKVKIAPGRWEIILNIEGSVTPYIWETSRKKILWVNIAWVHETLLSCKSTAIGEEPSDELCPIFKQDSFPLKSESSWRDGLYSDQICTPVSTQELTKST